MSTTPTPFHIFPPNSRFIRYNTQLILIITLFPVDVVSCVGDTNTADGPQPGPGDSHIISPCTHAYEITLFQCVRVYHAPEESHMRSETQVRAKLTDSKNEENKIQETGPYIFSPKTVTVAWFSQIVCFWKSGDLHQSVTQFYICFRRAPRRDSQNHPSFRKRTWGSWDQGLCNTASRKPGPPGCT